MKKVFLVSVLSISLFSCKEIQYHYVEGSRDIVHNKLVLDTIPFISENDTTAYKEALKRFYTNERNSKSTDTVVILFNLLDKNGKPVMSEDETLDDIYFKDSLIDIVLKEIN